MKTVYNPDYLASVGEILGNNPIERIDTLTSDTYTYLLEAAEPLKTLGDLLGTEGKVGKLLLGVSKALYEAIESYSELQEIVTGGIANNDDDV